MRNFSWTYFAMTGDVDAFLLYKEVDQLAEHGSAGDLQAAAEETEAEISLTE
ncbi:YqzL family protein [Paenibacillus abyssi]|uniref:YqzL family protein n=1 Tax=Paenibacillus abyssi TaxID=1340531 RepID=A0A917D364_9BACL|nr:YqzL family protein [Paenibacillus abyssi]GGG10603.1 hypothetical protein GCM10010916_29350 [Paenibacillus abyssi]